MIIILYARPDCSVECPCGNGVLTPPLYLSKGNARGAHRKAAARWYTRMHYTYTYIHTHIHIHINQRASLSATSSAFSVYMYMYMYMHVYVRSHTHTIQNTYVGSGEDTIAGPCLYLAVSCSASWAEACGMQPSAARTCLQTSSCGTGLQTAQTSSWRKQVRDKVQDPPRHIQAHASARLGAASPYHFA